MRKVWDTELIAKLRLKGKTAREISVIMCVSEPTIQRYLSQLGLTNNQALWKRKTHKEDDATLKRWALMGPYGD